MVVRLSLIEFLALLKTFRNMPSIKIEDFKTCDDILIHIACNDSKVLVHIDGYQNEFED